MSKQQTKTKYLSTLAMVAALALLAGATASWLFSQTNRTNNAPTLKAATALLEQARPLPNFSLVDQNGQRFGNKQLQGHWSFLFFGYTYCPDVCPTTLATLNATLTNIAQNNDQRNTQVVFVSVDPERDSYEQLKGYVEYFNPEFIGLTGNPSELDVLAANLGILRTKVANPADPDNYLMDHTAAVLLIGPKGRLVALFSAPHEATTLADDFHNLRRYYEKG